MKPSEQSSPFFPFYIIGLAFIRVKLFKWDYPPSWSRLNSQKNRKTCRFYNSECRQNKICQRFRWETIGNFHWYRKENRSCNRIRLPEGVGQIPLTYISPTLCLNNTQNASIRYYPRQKWHVYIHVYCTHTDIYKYVCILYI